MESNSRISAYVPGAGRIMATDHGTHPPEFWAQVTAEQIAPINPDMTGKRRTAAAALQAKIAEALEVHHNKIDTDEKAALRSDASRNALEAHPDHVREEAHAALDDVVAAAVGTPWEKHFLDEAVQEAVLFEIARMFASHQHVERSHHRGQAAKGATN